MISDGIDLVGDWIHFNGHLFWFSFIILFFSSTYLLVVHNKHKRLNNMSQEKYEEYYKEKHFLSDTYVIAPNQIESERRREQESYKKVTLDKIKAFSIGPVISLGISLFWGHNIEVIVLGHTLNWLSVINLFIYNYNFKTYWKEVVKKVVIISSIIFVPLGFYFTIFFEEHTETLATFVTIFGFPITLASILTFVRPSK